MLKKLSVFLFAALLLVFFSNQTFAQEIERFATLNEVSYTVNANGTTNVQHNITLENLYSDYYATSYSLILSEIDQKSISAFSGNKPLNFEVKETNNQSTQLQIKFDEPVVGIGEKRQFSIRYNDTKIANRTGEVWEIDIPRVAQVNKFRSYSTTLNVPKDFGQLAFISPEATLIQENQTHQAFHFGNNINLANGVSAAFGQFQVFSFDLTYHLENPLTKTAFVEIALPPDTAYQRIILGKLDPKADNVYPDSDGNWLARYNLTPRQRLDVKAQGHVQVFSTPVQLFVVSENVLSDALQPTSFWQTQDPQIQRLAQELENPQAIYDYVVKTLRYDYERVKPNIARFGALRALQNPQNAICMEFTDLFVAIARVAGIPAREVNGYAYAENPEIQPLSLVADVLHSWAEYWDPNLRVWVPVDPTWGNTTGGVDFFHKLDLRHFAFVMHGKDSVIPYPAGSYKLGANPQKDVFVSFASLPQKRNSQIELEVASQVSRLFGNTQLQIKIKNTGTTAIYNTNSKVFFDNKEQSTNHIAAILPHGSETQTIDVPSTFLAHEMPSQVTLIVGNQRIDVPSHKEIVLLSNISLVF